MSIYWDLILSNQPLPNPLRSEDYDAVRRQLFSVDNPLDLIRKPKGTLVTSFGPIHFLRNAYRQSAALSGDIVTLGIWLLFPNGQERLMEVQVHQNDDRVLYTGSGGFPSNEDPHPFFLRLWVDAQGR